MKPKDQQRKQNHVLEQQITDLNRRVAAKEELLQALRNQLQGITQSERQFLQRMQTRS